MQRTFFAEWCHRGAVERQMREAFLHLHSVAGAVLPIETASDLNGNREGRFGWLTALNIMLGNEPFGWVNCFHFLVWLLCWMGIREAKGGLFIQKEKGLSWSFGGWWKSRVGNQGLPQGTSRSENLMAFPNSKSLERLGSFLDLNWRDHPNAAGAHN